jgi:hypothetical protein
MGKKLKKLLSKVASYMNKLLPKYNQVLIHGYPNTESSAIAVANYISLHYSLPVYYVTYHEGKADPLKLLSPDIILVPLKTKRNMINHGFVLKYLTSKYIFFTTSSKIDFFSDRQIVTNIWHGIFYKKIAMLCGNPPLLADITVGTSVLTKKMFSEAFGVSEDSVYISGYPRNDMLFEAQKNKGHIKKRIPGVSPFQKIAIWMPTFRNNTLGYKDGVEVGNPFYIENFDISSFNNLLKENNTLCLLKPHPSAPKYKDYRNVSNVRFIDNMWIAEQGMTLYHLLGCTDLLISDVSSVIIDYMLLDQPIICVSTDFEEYRASRGFYFEDIENWIPGRINTNQEMFFEDLENVIKNGEDPSKQKREKLKKYFFDHQDEHSTERLAKYVLGSED